MIKVTYEGKVQKLRLTLDGSLSEALDVISKATGVEVNNMMLLSGFPPAPLKLDAVASKCSDTIKGGDSITVKSLKIIRHIVPADNSCLFTSINYLLRSSSSSEANKNLREEVASFVLSNSSDWNEATLGKTPEDYAAWIRRDSSWGGEIELAIISQLKGIEVAAVDIKTTHTYIYGEGKGYGGTIYLLYDGIHYDALETSSGDKVLTPGSVRIKGMVVALAEELRKQRLFTDTGSFTLRCMVCSQGIVGNEEAQEHAKKTGHINFAEY